MEAMVRHFRAVSIPIVALFAVLVIGLALGLSQAAAVLMQAPARHSVTLPPPAQSSQLGAGVSQNQPVQQPNTGSVPASPAPEQAAPVNQSSAVPAGDRCSGGSTQGGRALPMCAPLAPQP